MSRSAWSSAATAPAVARVTPSPAPSAARVGARPWWISASAGPSCVRPREGPGGLAIISVTCIVYFVSPVNKVQHARSATRHGSSDRTGLAGDRTGLARARAALCAVFAAHGFIFASWAVRVPAIKEQTGASPAALGLALLGLSAGAVATMLIAGTLCRRFGSQRIAVISCALLSVTLVLPALARSATTLGLALLVFGAAYGASTWP